MFKLVFSITCLLAIFCNVKADISHRLGTYLPPKPGYEYTRPTTTTTTPRPTTTQRTTARITTKKNVYLPPTEAATQPNIYLPPTESTAYYYPTPQNPTDEDHHHHEPGMPFDFRYDVNDADTANFHSHQSKSDGDVTKGEYSILMPDGRTQVVRYTADWRNGYNAEVSYE